MGRELSGHGAALDIERHFLKTESLHSKCARNVTKQPICRKIWPAGSKNEYIKNKTFKKESHNSNQNNRKRGSYKMPSQFFQMVQKGHFFFGRIFLLH